MSEKNSCRCTHNYLNDHQKDCPAYVPVKENIRCTDLLGAVVRLESVWHSKTPPQNSGPRMRRFRGQ